MKKESPKFISMRKAAEMCGLSFPAFRASFKAGFFPFSLYRVSQFRNGFKYEDVLAFVAAQEERIVDLNAGESITAARVE